MNAMTMIITKSPQTRRTLWFCLILSGLLTTPRLQAKTVIISDNADYFALSPYAEYFEDKSDSFALADLLSGKGTFQELPHGKELIGYRSHSFWIKFTIQNQSGKFSRFGFESKSSLYTQFDLYLVKTGHIEQQAQLGYNAHQLRSLAGSRQPQIRFELNKDESATIWIHAKNPRKITLNMYLMQANLLDANNFIENGILAFYFGAMVALFCYNLILFLSLRNRSYLYYVVWVLAMAVTIAINTAMFDYLGWCGASWSWNERGMPLTVLPIPIGLLFGRRFLSLKKQQPLMDKLFLAEICSTLLLCVTLFIVDYPPGEDFITLNYLITAVLTVTGSIRAYRLGNPSAATYLLAWGIFILSGLIWLMADNGLITGNLLFNNSATLGSMVEMILMSLAQAQRIKALHNQHLMVEYQKKENENLHNFVRALCHDISNPLAIIQGAHELAQGFDHPPFIQKLWDKVDRGSAYIGEIITQVRKIETSRSGKMATKLVPTSLKDTLAKAYFLFEEKAKKKNLVFSCALPEGSTDIIVDVDPVTFSHEVMHNLVSNAIKFTLQNGKVRIEVQDHSSHVFVQVTDDGIGIPADIMATLFDVYRSSSRPGTDNEQGTGFGMPLVKNFVDSYGGSIEVISPVPGNTKEHPGTLVRIKLPKSTALAPAVINALEKAA